MAHYSYNPLTRIDTTDNTVSQVPGPVRPGQGIAIDRAGATAYLTYYTFYFGKGVAAVELAGPALLADLPGEDLNWSAAIAGDADNFLYVANTARNTVSVYDLSSLQQPPLLAVPVGSGPRGVAASVDRKKVYVANLSDGDVSVIDTTSNTVQGRLTAGAGAYDVAVSPDGTYLFVSNSFEGTISAIPTATPPAAAAQGTMATAASSSEDPGLGLALLRGFPPGCRVYADGEIPRREEQFEEGLSVSFPSETRELFLFCPGYRNRAVPVSVGAGETVVLDGQLLPE